MVETADISVGETSQDQQVDAIAPVQRGFTDATVRTRVTMLITLAAVLGCLVGMVEATLGHMIWPFLLGMTLVLLLVIASATMWITRPLEQLAHQLEVIARSRRPSRLTELPLGRKDELGRIAKAMHLMCIAAARDHHEARHLRKSLDYRIAESTRRATGLLRRMAMRDPLTELGNRRFLNDRLEPLVEATRASNNDLIALMIDMDNFKQVNDQLGHAAGDELLVFLGSLIMASVREDDLAIRLGGDEFLVLMPAATIERAGQLSESIRKLFLQQVRTMHPNGPHANLSIGVASLEGDGCRNGTELLEVGDTNLYAAKEAGKGCTRGA